MNRDTASAPARLGLSLLLATLCLVLGFFFVQHVRDANVRKSQTLVATAKTALKDSDYESAARLAIAATRANLPLLGFDTAEAEAVLSSAVVGSRRIGPGITFPADVRAFAWSEDGKTIAVLLEGQPLEDTVQVWDVARRTKVREFTQPTQTYIHSLAYSPVLKRFVALGGGAIYLLDPVSGAATRISLPDDADAKALTRRGDYLAIESDDKLRIWDMKANRLSGTAIALRGVEDVAFSGDGKTLFALGWDWLAAIELPSGRTLRRTETKMSERTLAVSPDGLHVATFGNQANALTLWDTTDLNTDSARIASGVNNAVFSPDSANLAVAAPDGHFQTLSSDYLSIETTPQSMPALAQASVGAANISTTNLFLSYAPGTKMLAVTQGRTLHLFDMTGSHPSREVQLPAYIDRVVYTDSTPPTAWMGGSRVLIMSGDRQKHDVHYQLWDVVTARPIGKPLSLDGWLAGTSEDNRYAVVLGGTRTRILDMDSGAYLPTTYPAITTFSSFPLYSSRYQTFVAESEDSDHIDIWTTRDGKTTKRSIISQCGGNFRLSPDGRYLVIYLCPDSADGFVYWDLETFKPVKMTHSQGLAASGVAAFSGKIALMLDDPGYFVDRRSGWAIAADGPPIAIPSFLDTYHQRTTIVGSKAYYLDYRHKLETYDLNPAIALRGKDLIALACKQTLPGGLSRFSDDEIHRMPLLDVTRDRDVCGR